MKNTQLGSSYKIFISENLLRMNENIAFETRKLKKKGSHSWMLHKRWCGSYQA